MSFVTRKALEFASEFPSINRELLEVSALLHDVNYIGDTTTGVDDGARMRAELLSGAGYSPEEIALIEKTVHDASTEYSGGEISDMSKALSDADKMFKVLPVGPIILTARYLTETKADIKKWADRIIREQRPLLDNDKYFYTQIAKQKYLAWAQINLQWVEQVRASIDDEDVQLFLQDCKELGFL